MYSLMSNFNTAFLVKKINFYLEMKTNTQI